MTVTSAGVSIRHIDEGAVVAAGQPVFRLVEDGRLEARVGVPQDAAAGIAVGDQLPVSTEGSRVTAQVSGLLPELDGRTRTTTVVLRLPDTVRGTVRPGQVVRLAVEKMQTTAERPENNLKRLNFFETHKLKFAASMIEN